MVPGRGILKLHLSFGTITSHKMTAFALLVKCVFESRDLALVRAIRRSWVCPFHSAQLYRLYNSGNWLTFELFLLPITLLERIRYNLSANPGSLRNSRCNRCIRLVKNEVKIHWTAKKNNPFHFCQRPHIKINPIGIKKKLYTGMLQYSVLITCPIVSDYLYNKEEIDDMHSNSVAESKVTERTTKLKGPYCWACD